MAGSIRKQQGARRNDPEPGTNLRSSDDQMPGIRRHRHGKSFRYRHDNGRPISAADRARIASLSIPPAYTDVWICADARGHIQATGRDARGRKQYRYHPDWRRTRDAGKFERMLKVGEALPALRRRVRADLASPSMPREKVLATVISILGRTLERVGNEVYRRDNGSFGLTTLRNRHAIYANGHLELRYRGKSGIVRNVRIDDARVARLVRRCRALPGQHLFEYVDPSGKVQCIDSGMVNSYLGSAMGEGITAKDLRTWGATQTAVAMLASMDPKRYANETERAGVEREVIRTVARLLSNTSAVCRASYIDPLAFAAWRSGRMQARFLRLQTKTRARMEKLTLQMLRAEHRRGRPGD